MQLTGKGDEAKYNVEYTSLPVTYDTTLNVLDTDYKSYAVIWSCNSIGPVGHTRKNININETKMKANTNFVCFFFYRICMGFDQATYSSRSDFTACIWHIG